MKILTAIDLSKSTGKVMEEASRLASKLSAKLYLLHVSDSIPEFLGMEHGPQSPRDTLLRRHKEAQTELAEWANKLRDSGLDVETKWTTGPIIEVVLKEARSLDVDMIVLGSHGHTAMYQILVGSVSEGVLHQSDIPVLVIPTHDR